MAAAEKTVSIPNGSSAEQKTFTDNLSFIQQTLARARIQYSLVGGMAIKAITEGTIVPRRTNGTVYDFDAVAFGPDGATINQTLRQLTPRVRDIEERIPPETMAIKTRFLNEIPFPCFPAKTILFRYLTRGGVMKQKDDSKLQALEKYILEHWNEEPADELYRLYLIFVERVRQRYPSSVFLYDVFWTADHFLADQISGSKGFFYSLIPLFRR